MGAGVVAEIGRSCCLVVSKPVIARCLERVHVHQSRLRLLGFVAGSDYGEVTETVHLLFVETREFLSQQPCGRVVWMGSSVAVEEIDRERKSWMAERPYLAKPSLILDPRQGHPY